MPAEPTYQNRLPHLGIGLVVFAFLVVLVMAPTSTPKGGSAAISIAVAAGVALVIVMLLLVFPIADASVRDGTLRWGAILRKREVPIEDVQSMGMKAHAKGQHGEIELADGHRIRFATLSPTTFEQFADEVHAVAPHVRRTA